MPEVIRPSVFGFIAGIVSEQLHGRPDLEKYPFSVMKCNNFQISHLGGAYKRTGFRHVTLTYSQTSEARRLIPFDFNATAGQAYCIEFSFSGGTTTLRFFRQGGLILKPDGTPYTVTTTHIPSAAAMLRMNYIQSVDRLYFADESFKPFTLSRFGDADWRAEVMTFTTDTSYPLPWAENNWPRNLMFYEDRLIFANTPQAPTTLWMSRTSNYSDFRINTAGASSVPLATDSIWIRMGGGKLTPIAWISDRRNLLVGTNNAEFSFSGGATNEPLTPENTGYQREGVYGSANIPPLPLEDAVIFISRSKKKIHEITLDAYNMSSFKVTQLNILCPEVVENTVKNMVQLEEPYNMIWCLLEDGTVAACTYVREQNITCWHTHSMGGEGKIVDVATTPTETGTALWAIVHYPRTNGYRIEVLQEEDPDLLEVFLDGYVSGTAAQDGRIGGLQNIMAGDVVDVVINGGYASTVKVPDDGVILDDKIKAGDYISVGYRYEGDLVISPIVFVSTTSTTEGAQKNLNNLNIKFWESIGGRVRLVWPRSSPTGAYGDWSQVQAFPYGAVLSEAPARRTYDWPVSPAGIYLGDAVTIEFNHAEPYPCNILCLSYDLSIGGVNGR